MKLGDIYRKIVKKEMLNAHRAEADVKMMIEILKILKGTS